MKKIFFIPILFFVVFIMVVYLVMPEIKSYQTLKEEVRKKEVSLQDVKDYAQQLQKTQQDLENYKPELDKINSALPADPDLASVFNLLQQKASENGVVITNVSLAQVPKKTSQPDQSTSAQKAEVSPLQEYRLSLTILVSAPSLENFLKSIEGSARLLEVKTLSILEKGKTQATTLKECNISLAVFSYPSQ